MVFPYIVRMYTTLHLCVLVGKHALFDAYVRMVHFLHMSVRTCLYVHMNVSFSLESYVFSFFFFFMCVGTPSRNEENVMVLRVLRVC